MSYYRQNRGSLGQAFPQTTQPESVPACTGGINALTSFMGMPVEDAIYLFNSMPSEYGLRLRKGYREWATGVDGDVRSLIPHDNQSGDNAKDRLFAVSENGIYDVSLFNTTVPAQKVVFATQGTDAGFGVSTNFVTDASDHLVLYADERNGLHYYDGGAEVWGQPGDGTFPPINFPDATTVDDIAFVTVHKQRVWLIAENGDNAYYLPVDAIAGDAIRFNFGSKFKHGGRLMGLWSWSVDGGDGVDDFLVGVSKAGDVLVYYGPDPSAPDWSLRGSYYIGEIPNARKIATEYAAELWLLSGMGIISIRDLLSGVSFSDIKVGPSAKITRFLRDAVLKDIEEPGWQLQIHPADGFLQVVTPFQAGGVPPRQYNMNLLTQGWGWWRDVPALCAQNWTNDYFMGGPDGVVYIYDGALDGTTLDGTLGLPIEFGGLTSFQPYGNHAQNMRSAFIRTIGITQGIVSINIEAVYDYDINKLVSAPPAYNRQGTNVWDTGLWDVDLWDYPAESSSVPLGTLGLGRTMAIGFRGSAESRITIVGWDILYNTGGLL